LAMRTRLRPVIVVVVVLAVAPRIATVVAMAADAMVVVSTVIVAMVAAMAAAATAPPIVVVAVVASIVSIVVAAAILAVAKLLLLRATVVAAVAMPPRLLPKPLPRPRRLLRRPRLRRTNPPNKTRPGHDSPGFGFGEASTLERSESRPVRDSAPNGLRLSKPDLELEVRLFLLHRDGPHARGRPMACD